MLITLVFFLFQFSAVVSVIALEAEYQTGDAHIHTKDSWDAYKVHPYLDVSDMVNASKSKDLEWAIITDHSDVVTRKWIFWGDQIIRDFLDQERWQNQKQKIQAITDFPILQGEELTMGNGKDLKTEGHFLAYGINDFIPTLSSLNDAKRPTAEDLIKEVKAKEGFGYISHPFKFGTLLLDAEPWLAWDLLLKYPDTIRGVEILHGNHDAPVATLNLWDRKLKQGKKLFGIGNSDAHQAGRHHIAYPIVGESFTYLHIPGVSEGESPTEAQIYGALKDGHSIISNGPFLNFTVNNKTPGQEVQATPGDTISLDINWKSTEEHGELKKIHLFDQGTYTDFRIGPFETLEVGGLSGQRGYNYSVRGEGYLRLKGETSKGKVVYTNPIFIETKGASKGRKESPVAEGPGDQRNPSIHNDRVVWQDRRAGNWDIYLKDLSTGKEKQITNHPADQINPKIHGSFVVWEDYRNGNSDIYLMDLVEGTEERLTQNPSAQKFPDIEGTKIVWQDNRLSNSDIFMIDLLDQNRFEVPLVLGPQNQTSPSLSGNFVAYEDWEETRRGYAYISYKNLATGEEQRILPTGSHEASPRLNQDQLVWNVHYYGNYPRTDIYMKNLTTGLKSPLIINEIGNESNNPAIEGTTLVWQDIRNNNYDIYWKNLSTGIVEPVTLDPFRQGIPDLSGDSVVWEDYRAGNWDIYTAKLFPKNPLSNKKVNIKPGQTLIQTLPISPEALHLSLGIEFGSKVSLTLISPNGTEITPSTPQTDYDLSYTGQAGGAYYQIDNPLPGEWQMKITAVQVSPAGEDVGVAAQAVVETPPTVSITNPQDDSVVKGVVDVFAQVQDDEDVESFGLYLNGEQVEISENEQLLNYSWDTTAYSDGSYQLSAIAEDPKLSFGQADAMVVVDNVLPSADAGADQTTSTGSEIIFDGSGSTDTAEFGFTWDFGDGATDSESSVTHAFSDPGTYAVAMTVVDATGASVTRVRSFSGSGSTVCTLTNCWRAPRSTRSGSFGPRLVATPLR